MTEVNSGEYETSIVVGDCRACDHEISIRLPSPVVYDRQRVRVRCAKCDTVTSLSL